MHKKGVADTIIAMGKGDFTAGLPTGHKYTLQGEEKIKVQVGSSSQTVVSKHRTVQNSIQPEEGLVWQQTTFGNQNN
jgi:hypothetical protein